MLKKILLLLLLFFVARYSMLEATTSNTGTDSIPTLPDGGNNGSGMHHQ